MYLRVCKNTITIILQIRNRGPIIKFMRLKLARLIDDIHDIHEFIVVRKIIIVRGYVL